MNIAITIFVNDVLYGLRDWAAVPRVGDWVHIQGEKAGAVEVEQVIWDEEKSNQVCVRLFCKTVK